MDEFNGPHFSSDLIGPDGRLTRLHKGGKKRAARAALMAQAQSARDAASARKEATRARADAAKERGLAASRAKTASKQAAKSQAEAKRMASEYAKQQETQQAALLDEQKKNSAMLQKRLDEQSLADNQVTQHIVGESAKRRKKRSAFGVSSTRSGGFGSGLGGKYSPLG